MDELTIFQQQESIEICKMIRRTLKGRKDLEPGDKILIGNNKHKVIIAIKILK